MDSIVNKIIEIDNNARQKLENAFNLKSKIISDAELEEDKIKKDILKRVSGRVAKVEEFEKANAEEKIEIIKTKAKESIQLITNKFEDYHAQWEDCILNKIIHNSH